MHYSDEQSTEQKVIKVTRSCDLNFEGSPQNLTSIYIESKFGIDVTIELTNNIRAKDQ